ncbi:MAG: FIST signal transduction protein, partial [Candidatus Sericytochromatia bacterium]
MLSLELNNNNILKIKDPEWILVYSTVEDLKQDNLELLISKFPNTSIFGTTSFNGVFTPEGFKKGCFLLVGEKNDGIKAVAVMKEANENNAFDLATQAAEEIKNKFGRLPDTLLFHPTPGFEEKIIAGIDKVFESKVPIYGGSAADNTIEGDWKIHIQNSIIGSGFLIIGFISENNEIYGSFSSGYIPTQNKGIVTKANGRTIFEIDHKPATEVYNKWSSGTITQFTKTDGVILSDTTLNPLGIILSNSNESHKYLISHPYKVHAKEKAISFFTEFKE